MSAFTRSFGMVGEQRQPRSFATLPCDNRSQWSLLSNLFTELAAVSDATELVAVLSRIRAVAGNTSEGLNSSQEPDRNHAHAGETDNVWPFSGLAVFLQEVCSYAERQAFFDGTLPFIASLASQLSDLAPRDGLVVLTRQHGELKGNG